MSTADTIEAVRIRLRSNSFGDVSEDVIGIQAAILATEYVRHYYNADYQRYNTEAVELETDNSVVNPTSGAKSRTFFHSSKLDGLAFDRFSNETVIIEHKSTGEDLGDGSPYWRKLTIDSQVSKYILSMKESGRVEVRSVLYDVVKKPTTGPKRVVAKLVREAAETGAYYGFWIPAEELATLRQAYEAGKGKSGGFTGKYDETMVLYGLRLRSIVSSDPAAFFQRRLIVRTDEEIEEYASELWQLSKEIRESRNAGVAPRNTSNCSQYGRLCEYFPICTGERSKEDDLYEIADFVHSEIEGASVGRSKNGGRDCLTNSRLTMFQSCRQREKLRYEDGLRKVTDSDSVALQWGTLFHDLMETVWLSYGRKTESDQGETGRGLQTGLLDFDAVDLA